MESFEKGLGTGGFSTTGFRGIACNRQIIITTILFIFLVLKTERVGYESICLVMCLTQFPIFPKLCIKVVATRAILPTSKFRIRDTKHQITRVILFHMRKIRYTRLQITRATLLHMRKVHIRDTLQTRNKFLLMVRAYYLAPSGTAGGAALVVGLQYCLSHPASFALVKHLFSLSEVDWMINDAAWNTVFKVSGRQILYNTDCIIPSSSTVWCNECDWSDGSMACM